MTICDNLVCVYYILEFAFRRSEKWEESFCFESELTVVWSFPKLSFSALLCELVSIPHHILVMSLFSSLEILSSIIFVTACLEVNLVVALCSMQLFSEKKC